MRNYAVSAKKTAIIAVFVSLLIAIQYALSFVPGVELVTVTFTAFCCVFGTKRGMIAATCFALLRQLVFGFFPIILALYLIYFNLLAVVFGGLGKRAGGDPKLITVITLSVIGTLCFTLLDNVLTPLWHGYSEKAFLLYFKASVPFALIQALCSGISALVLFKPLTKAIGRFAN